MYMAAGREWTERVPTAPGYFWYHDGSVKGPTVVQIAVEPDAEIYVASDLGQRFTRAPVDAMEGRWAGPVYDIPEELWASE